MLNDEASGWEGLSEAVKAQTVFEGVDWAAAADEQPIYDMLMQLHAENGAFSVDDARVRLNIKLGTQRQGGIIGVIRGETGLEASVGMVLDQWWYTEDWCLSERWNFVLPAFRKSDHAQRLIEFSKWCADRLSLPLMMGIISTQQTEAKLRLYRRFLTPVGGFFVYNMPGLKAVDPAAASVNPRYGKVDVQ